MTTTSAFTPKVAAKLSVPGIFALSYASAFIGSKYLGLSIGYALDDYAVTHSAPEGLAGFFLSQGRYTNAALDVILRASDLNMTNFSVLAFIATLIFSTLFYLVVFSPRPGMQPIMAVAVAAILGAHSYYTEYVTFRQSALPMSLMFAMLWLALRQYRIAMFQGDKRLTRLCVAFCAGVIAMGANQLALCFAAIGILYMHLADVADREKSAPTYLLPEMGRALLFTGVAGAALTAGNLLSAALFRALSQVAPDGRATLVSIEQLPERAAQLLELMPVILTKAEPIAGSPAKILLLLSAMIALIPLGKSNIRTIIPALLFAITAWGIALLPNVASGTWWPVPRTLVAVPIVFAGILGLSSHLVRWQAAASTGLALAAAVLFCAHSNAMLLNQQRVNRWDIAQAQQIAYRVAERFPDKHQKLAVVGGKWTYGTAPLVAQGDMNLSAMSVGWAIDPLFDEATGTNLDVRSAPELSKACEGKAVFPSKDSTFESGDEIVVCL